MSRKKHVPIDSPSPLTDTSMGWESLDQVNRISEALSRFTKATERCFVAVERCSGLLARFLESRYTSVTESNQQLVGESEMASILSISRRTLAHHRKSGRFPNCWLKNGKRVFWRETETVEAWNRGIA